MKKNRKGRKSTEVRNQAFNPFHTVATSLSLWPVCGEGVLIQLLISSHPFFLFPYILLPASARAPVRKGETPTRTAYRRLCFPTPFTHERSGEWAEATIQ